LVIPVDLRGVFAVFHCIILQDICECTVVRKLAIGIKSLSAIADISLRLRLSAHARRHDTETTGVLARDVT
jgi:hypothetical protein